MRTEGVVSSGMNAALDHTCRRLAATASASFILSRIMGSYGIDGSVGAIDFIEAISVVRDEVNVKDDTIWVISDARNALYTCLGHAASLAQTCEVWQRIREGIEQESDTTRQCFCPPWQ